MSSNPAVVFKCRQPELMDNWEALQDQLWADWKIGQARLREELGVETLVQNSGMGGVFISGYAPRDGSEEPKPGFRRDRKTGYMLPALRTPEGKRWQGRLYEVRYSEKIPGVPPRVIGGGYMGVFKREKIGADWYAWLGFDPGESQLARVSPDIWEPVKLSAYHAAKEEAGA